MKRVFGSGGVVTLEDGDGWSRVVSELFTLAPFLSVSLSESNFPLLLGL